MMSSVRWYGVRYIIRRGSDASCKFSACVAIEVTTSFRSCSASTATSTCWAPLLATTMTAPSTSDTNYVKERVELAHAEFVTLKFSIKTEGAHARA